MRPSSEVTRSIRNSHLLVQIPAEKDGIRVGGEVAEGKSQTQLALPQNVSNIKNLVCDPITDNLPLSLY